MKKTITEYRTFFREFRETFNTTGAIAPSGRSLARATVRPLSEHQGPKRVLEVGPGTGAITKEIVKHIHPGDVFDLVEVNERFVELLQRQFEQEPTWRQVAPQTRVWHKTVQEMPTDEPYDYIVCGVPFNNFSIGLTREIFRHMIKLLKPGGTLSFFEYLWIRRLKLMVVSQSVRKRLGGDGQVLGRYLDRYEFRCDTCWINFPPCMSHHLRVTPKKMD
ncbi:MAG: class I SAM-dependent methyltransferase [Planctomycetota bacterium]